jgi:hypothetical protein
MQTLNRTRFALLGASLALLAGGTVRAQEDGSRRTPSSDFLFPRPSGQNGYEELVLAGDIVSTDPVLREFAAREGGGMAATLTEKRAVLATPAAKRAFALVRQGIRKPVLSPRVNPDDETRYPELAQFRSLARLYAVRIYVECADGRLHDAINSLEEALRFGYVMQTDSLISGLVSIAADAIVLGEFGKRLDQLSARDCERLLTVAQAWMRLPDPALRTLEAERAGILQTLRKYRGQPEKFVDTFLPADDDAERMQQRDLALRVARGEPATVSRAFDEAETRLNAYFRALLTEMRKPLWQRAAPPELNDGSLGGRLLDLLGATGTYTLAGERYAQEQASVQMLGIHAAIRRYRWEHNRLPAALSELKLGALVLDPFTGQEFSYRLLSDEKYALGSAGPLERGMGEGIKTGERRPFSFPAERKP